MGKRSSGSGEPNRGWGVGRGCQGIFFFKQKTAYEIRLSLVGSEMCIRDRIPDAYSCAPSAPTSTVIMLMPRVSVGYADE